jgi:UDP-N-acetylglucosamine:LPS N-acetylglucosamine transferase
MIKPLVAAIDMGYGHLRPAAALADELGTQVLAMDAPPLGEARDREFWDGVRRLYEPLTRISQLPFVGLPARGLLNAITAIPPLRPGEDLSGATQGTRWLRKAAGSGVGRGLAEHLRKTGEPLLATFYAAAVLAEMHGTGRLHCVVTDSDVNRVWVPQNSKGTKIKYFAPTELTRQRLEGYGVPPSNIRVTGYPLPGELVGRDGARRKANHASRLGRLGGKGERPLIVFAIGGAGAQVPLARALIAGMEKQIRAGELRLALVAGRRPEVARALSAALSAHRLEGHAGVEMLFDPDVFGYIRRFNALLARADALWTKPSELIFFAGLGLPIIAAPPVGMHEEANLRWAADRGAALAQGDPAAAGEWLSAWVKDGVLGNAAGQGMRLPHLGLYEIADAVAKA